MAMVPFTNMCFWFKSSKSLLIVNNWIMVGLCYKFNNIGACIITICIFSLSGRKVENN